MKSSRGFSSLSLASCRAQSGWPSKRIAALSRPMRVDFPPASSTALKAGFPVGGEGGLAASFDTRSNDRPARHYHPRRAIPWHGGMLALPLAGRGLRNGHRRGAPRPRRIAGENPERRRSARRLIFQNLLCTLAVL